MTPLWQKSEKTHSLGRSSHTLLNNVEIVSLTLQRSSCLPLTRTRGYSFPGSLEPEAGNGAFLQIRSTPTPTDSATRFQGSDQHKRHCVVLLVLPLRQRDDEQKLEAKEPLFSFGSKELFEKLLSTIKFINFHLKTFNSRGLLQLQLPTFARKTLHLLPGRRPFRAYNEISWSQNKVAFEDIKNK